MPEPAERLPGLKDRLPERPDTLPEVRDWLPGLKNGVPEPADTVWQVNYCLPESNDRLPGWAEHRIRNYFSGGLPTRRYFFLTP